MDTNPKLDPKKQALEKKRSELSSRYHSLSYASEDYDRKKGKGAFAKAFPEANKLMDGLLKEKTQIDIDRALEPREEPKEASVANPAPVPVI